MSVVSPGNLTYSEKPDITDLDTTAALYEKVKELVEIHASTLIFTNTRSGAERVSYKLAKMVNDRDKDKIGTHHGSLSRETRVAVEEGLKDIYPECIPNWRTGKYIQRYGMMKRRACLEGNEALAVYT